MPRFTLKLSHKALILVAIPLVFEACFVATLYSMLVQTEEQVQQEFRAKAILRCFNHLNFAMGNSMRHLMTLLTIGGHESYQGYKESIDSVKPQFAQLKILLKDNPQKLIRIKRLEDVAEDCHRRLDAILDASQQLDQSASRIQMRELKPILAQFTKESNDIRKDSEQTEQQAPINQLRERQHLQIALIIGVVFNLVLAIFLVILFNKSTTRRFAVLMDNTRRLATGEPLNPPLEGSDEIAHLDRVFNEMAITIAEAVEKERAVVDHAQEVICSLDEYGSFNKVNRAALKVWGYEPEDLIGTPVFNIISEEDRESAKKAIDSLKSTSPNLTFENRIIARNGTIVDTLWSSHWSEIDRSIFCVANNITDRKQMERLKQEFYSMVTHDLRTPLGSVYGILTLVCAKAFGPLAEEVEVKLKTAQVNIQRLVTLINDLLDLDKLEAGKMPLEKDDVDSGDILDRSIMALETYAQQQEIKLEKLPGSTLIYADGDRLIQVLVNLISNAVKFSPKGSTVTISTAEFPEWVEFMVQDRGRGIPAAYKTAIFERFQQVEAADARRNVGTGLGLSVCKMIIENHGGTIGVHSEEGKGSTFWFRIPKIAKITPDESAKEPAVEAQN